MKSFLKVIVLFLIFMVIAYSSPLINREDSTALFKSYDAKQGNLKMKVDSKETPIKYNEEKSIAQYIGKPFSLIEKKYGKPNRMYATPYEYDNYVYNKGQEGYLIVGGSTLWFGSHIYHAADDIYCRIRQWFTVF